MKALFAMLAVALVVTAAAAARPERLRLHVFAATSLAAVLPQIDRGETYTFAGSSTLAARVKAGAHVAVFVSANTSDPAALYRRKLVLKPVVFAHNTVVIVTPPSNPAHVKAIADLAQHGVKVEIADETVALGGYTLQILKRLHLNAVLDNVAGRDDDVRTVVAKVEAGEVDAALVYSSDAQAAKKRLHVVAIPKNAQPAISYSAAVVRSTTHRAAAVAFVKALRSARSQELLRLAGFR